MRDHGARAVDDLYAVHRTRLAEQIKTGEVTLLEMEEYVQLLADFLERLPPQIVIERISGDAPPRDLIAPQWVLDKGSIKKRLNEVLEERGTYQGAKYDATRTAAIAVQTNSLPLLKS